MSDASPARLAANRANAQRCTGPRTAAGKATSAQNATKHGLTARQPFLPGEDEAAFDALRLRLHGELKPRTAIEELLADEVTGIVWRLWRVARVEVALYAVAMHAPAWRALADAGETDAALGFAFVENAANFGHLSRYETALVHRMRRALGELERYQTLRLNAAPLRASKAGGR